MTPFDLQQQQIERRRKVAEAMIASSMQPLPGTQVVSGVAVRNSPLQGAAKLIEAWKGGQEKTAADQAQSDLLTNRNEQTNSAIQDFLKATTPHAATPGEPYSTPEGETGTTPGTPAFNPTAQDRRAAAMKLEGQISGDPREAAKLLVAQALKGPRYVAVPSGSSLTEIPANGGPPKTVVTNPKPDAVPSSVQQYEYAKKQGYTGTYNDWLLEQKRAGATKLNVDTKQPSAESQAVGAFYGKDFADIQKAGRLAETKLANYDRIGELLQGVSTGKLTGVGTNLAAYAKSLGFNIDPKLGEKQAAIAFTNQIALQLRNPSGGAGMPGALSDKDREFLMSMTPGLANTPEGNALIIQTAKRLAQRDIEVAQMARDYRAKHHHMDEGFYTQLAQYSAAHPLFAGLGGTPGAGSAGLTKNADGTYTYNR